MERKTIIKIKRIEYILISIASTILLISLLKIKHPFWNIVSGLSVIKLIIIGVIIAKRAKTIINDLEIYIEHHLKRGHKEEHIKKKLKKEGWHEKHIHRHMERVKKRLKEN
ncbi:MAG: hypothetical protein KAU20_00025 [Nanoarchaeota archaeon]|nr:hypothetical protein [Nanoarchaeota archaeon]